MRKFPFPLVATLVVVACSDPPTVATDARPESSPPLPSAAVRTQSGLAGPGTANQPHWADGYVWANQPYYASYIADPHVAFNRAGGAIQITKPAGTTGRYLVRFTGLSAWLGATSTVKVTGYWTDNTSCKPVSPKLTGDVVDVRCFEGSTGAAVDAMFNVLVTGVSNELAFAHGSQPTGNNYAPPASSSWNPNGTIRITRNGTGRYQVLFAGVAPPAHRGGGHVQVGAVGTAREHCKVGSWGGGSDVSVDVRCFTRAGNPVNTKFNVLFVKVYAPLGFAWADQPSSTSYSYTPDVFYSFNSSLGAINISRWAPGRYRVEFSGLEADLLDRGHVAVTAYGLGNAQCKNMFLWGQYVDVRCFDPSGADVDSYFTVLLGS